MEANRKRPGTGITEESDGKRPKSPAMSDDTGGKDEDEVTAWFTVDDETANELAKLLDTEISSPIKVKIIDDPYSSPLIFQSSSSSYITINGNEESCGSSFSDLDSSVMVGINIGRVRSGIESLTEWFAGAGGGAWGFDGEKEVEENGEGSSLKGFNGSDCLDCDDVARFLGEDLSETLE